ncbi:hypothetical protein [Enterococcus crotali]|uniref:hypothetical protein n=1 Tax=Enterococcus crotali TaxID=1453587 RepID=UPI00046FE743|nr:hypothetical protein [Enterococcus crotali]
MKVPVMWKVLGCFLVVVPLIGLFGLVKLGAELGIGIVYEALGTIMWLSLFSVIFSVIVGVLLFKGSIWGYHLTKVLIGISVLNGVLLIFDFDPVTFYSLLIRIIVLSQVIYSKKTNLYLSELRHNAKRKIA